MSMCMTTVSDFEDLENIQVTANNSADIVNVIEDLLKDENSLTDPQLEIIIDKLSAVTKIATLTTVLAGSITNILSNICEYTTNLSQVTNEILYITDLMGDRTVFTGSYHNMTAPSLALQLIIPDTSQFQGLTFGVSSFQTGLTPECTQSNMMLNSYVVSASITNATVSDLKIPVVVTFQHLQQKEDQAIVKCVYWDFNKNNGIGGWNDEGCEIKRSNATYTLCYCDHLTHFGVLLDISKTPINPEDEEMLTIISYLGCGVSSIFLGVTLLTYVGFEKLRRDNPSKILINLSVALLGLNIFFLVNSWFASFDSDELCIAVAAIQHYFLLAAFTWMGLEAINMYLALVKIRKMRVNKTTGSRKGLLHDLRVVTSLTFLLGLTWLPAFFAWGQVKTPLLYLFSTLNSLQDWSRSVTLGAKVKGGLQVSPSLQSETTSDRKISDCSHSGSSHDQVCLKQDRVKSSV
ncbi:Adhesion G-protein coupled receptor G4 [Triplophysa tibetana]|uniref:Adhesion G-protein coupled receptor G4 n=1 Tax=Triplophysa tibetana TaxID=1572043 RepID=A0A5A9NJ20_9TELE|nr:Adhesion G-protein coupled receptor G4 [Triplophysa tibetana]